MNMRVSREPRPKNRCQIRYFDIKAREWTFAVDPKTGETAVFTRRKSAQNFVRKHFSKKTKCCIVPIIERKEVKDA